MNIVNHIAATIQCGWSTDLANQYNSWHYEVLHKKWSSFADLQDDYTDAEYLAPGKVAFHIMRHRAVIYVHIEYAIGWVYVRFVGTNEEFAAFMKKIDEVA